MMSVVFCNSTHNRTIVELKFAPVIHYIIKQTTHNRTIVELKLAYCVDKSFKFSPHNRTIVELKYISQKLFAIASSTHNRTIVELKYRITSRCLYVFSYSQSNHSGIEICFWMTKPENGYNLTIEP